MTAVSPEFEAMWNDHDVRTNGEGTKYLQKPGVGAVTLDYSAFSIGGQPGLSIMIFTPVTPIDRARVKALIEARFE